MSVLDNASIAGDLIFNLFSGNSYVIIIDNEGNIIKTWDVPHLPFGLKPGTKIPEGTVTYKALQESKRISVIMTKDKSKFGFGYVGISIPIYDENNGLAGILTITSPILQQDQIREISGELKMDAEQSDNVKNSILSISGEVNGTVGKLNGIIEELQQNIGVITDVINLIHNVAGQTSLLGLNAAIEAARSGEHGKGFTVVAQEIRRLSDTVKSSANELNTRLSLLNNIIDSINPQVKSMNDFLAKQASSVKEIDSVIKRMATSTERLDSIANESWL